MTINECRIEIERLNSEYREFIEHELPVLLNAKNGKVSVSKWFAAQAIISERGYARERLEFVRTAREAGHEVKINMQDYTIKYYGEIEGGDAK